jgi:hypothetical protein
MSILVNFEDSYGMADIACKYFFDKVIEVNKNEETYDNVIIRRALSTANIFSYKTIPKDITTIVYVYDMDRQSNKDPYNFLEPETLQTKVEKLSNMYRNINLRFIPVAFAAETICLHMMKPDTLDFSLAFSSVNTAHLHTKILTDILANIHTDTNDRRYWLAHGQGKHTFAVKRTREYMDDFKNLDDVVKILEELHFSETNKSLFEWLENGKADDTSMLLNSQQAIEMQKHYRKEYEEFITNNKVEEIKVDNRTYMLNCNYK